MTPRDPATEYRIDADNRIVAVNAEWDRFALANDTPDLAGGKVLGTVLFDHIRDSTLRQLTDNLLQMIRADGRQRELDFNCDSPDRVRAMRMQILPSPDGSLLFSNTTLSERARLPLALRLDGIAGNANIQQSFITMCSWCNRGASGATWLELEAAITAHRMFTSERPPCVTHGLCPDCESRLQLEVSA